MTESRISLERIDRELGSWLVEESGVRAPVGLVEDVFARTTRTPQASRWWPPTRAVLGDVVRGGSPRRPVGPSVVGRRPAPIWRGLAPAAGLLAVVVVAVALVVGSGWRGTGPGGTSSPISSPSGSLSPTIAPSAPTPSASRLGPPVPEPTTVGAFPARRLDLGSDAAPIHVFSAFDSIWVANIHANDVRRYDPDTMAEVARIPVDSAAWFAATGDALWVTSQTGQGVSRIDPATNTVVAHVGDVPPCAAPVVALNSVWQAACDGNAILRIDPRTNKLLKRFPLNGRVFLVYAGGRFLSVGREGLETMDPGTGTFTRLGGGRPPEETALLASDGDTLWEANIAGLVRIDPATGRTIASFPYANARGISFSGDHAWVTVGAVGAIEIDLATNRERRTIPLPASSLLPLEAAGALWLTDFDTSTLWRIDLPPSGSTSPGNG
jgi:hypothetical protein